jgi:hypothetical protein
MKRFARSACVYRSALLLLIAVGFAGCAEPQPPEFLAKEHKFRVRFGSPPKVSEKAGLTKSAVYSVEGPDGALTVTVTELPIPDGDPPDRAAMYLASAQDDLIRAANGTRTSESAIALAGKYPGREFSARFTSPQPGAMRVRIYLVGKRLYQVAVYGTDDYTNAPAATAFLESFMVVE